jgi:hypothetical protein
MIVTMTATTKGAPCTMIFKFVSDWVPLAGTFSRGRTGFASMVQRTSSGSPRRPLAGYASSRIQALCRPFRRRPQEPSARTIRRGVPNARANPRCARGAAVVDNAPR